MQHSGRDTRRTAAGLAAIAAGAALIIGGLPGGAGAAPMQEATPSSSIVEDENATCEKLGEYDFDAKIDAEPEEKLYENVEGTGLDVDITDFTPGEGDVDATVSLTTNFPISAVFVKSGTGGILYTSDPPATIWNNLASPNPSISHISFCWNEEDMETTSTTSTTEKGEETTTTEKGEETTTTEKGEETTTTEKGEETTTTVEGETTSTTAAGEVTTTTVSEGELPRTGNNTAPMLGLGAALLAGGTALIAGTRRLRNSQN